MDRRPFCKGQSPWTTKGVAVGGKLEAGFEIFPVVIAGGLFVSSRTHQQDLVRWTGLTIGIAQATEATEWLRRVQLFDLRGLGLLLSQKLADHLSKFFEFLVWIFDHGGSTLCCREMEAQREEG